MKLNPIFAAVWQAKAIVPEDKKDDDSRREARRREPTILRSIPHDQFHDFSRSS